MKHEILPNGNLRLWVDKADQEMLKNLKEELESEGKNFDSDDVMHDLLAGNTHSVLNNSEYDFVRPEQIGALTDAPCLATFGPERLLREGETEGIGNRHTGTNHGEVTVEDITECWVFTSYQVESVQGALLERGEAIWQKG